MKLGQWRLHHRRRRPCRFDCLVNSTAGGWEGRGGRFASRCAGAAGGGGSSSSTAGGANTRQCKSASPTSKTTKRDGDGGGRR